MKRFMSLFIVLILGVCLCSCNSKKKAFEASKEAYNNVNAAYEITETFSLDVYEAWRLGIDDDDEILDEGVSYLSSELNLTEDELKDGVAYVLNDLLGDDDWADISEEEKDQYRSMTDTAFPLFEDNLFSFCVMIVQGAYETNGDIAKVKEYLDAAKSQMKELSENYSDYEHYPSLKEYYTTTSAFFDFCQNPNCSFNQIKTTIENYRNSARDSQKDLDFVFED